MIAPAFLLNFTSATLDQRIAFARALNTATFINSSGLVEVVNADKFNDTMITPSFGLIATERALPVPHV